MRRLSGGMRWRAGVAWAIVGRSAVLPAYPQHSELSALEQPGTARLCRLRHGYLAGIAGVTAYAATPSRRRAICSREHRRTQDRNVDAIQRS